MDGVEKEELVKKCAEMLGNMIRDVTVPKNIKKSAGEIKNKLLNADELLALRTATAVSELEELASSPNIPPHTRTLVWGIVGQLETVSIDE